MEKIAGQLEIADVLSLEVPLTDVIERVAERKGKAAGDVTVIMLDRAHDERWAEIRELGARSAPSPTATSPRRCSRSPRTPASTCSGDRRHSLEGAICRGDHVPRRPAAGQLWPRDEDERQAPIDAGYDLERDPRRRPARLG